MTFREEVSFVEHHEAGDGWRISPHGRVVTECLGFDEAADEPPDQQARWKHVAQSLLHTLAAVATACAGFILPHWRWLSGRNWERRSLISWLAFGSKIFRMQNFSS